VQAGRRPRATGVVARRYRLAVTLKQPTMDFPERMTTPFFCAVPPGLPVDAEGVRAPLHAAGPYYISEYVPDRRVVLRRNRYYGGTRPHHVEVFRADLTSATGQEVADRIDSGRADWGIAGAPLPYFLAGLDKKYGINRARFFLKPGLNIRGFALNVSRSLFRNPKLRRAVNYAIDRAAIRRATPGGIRVSRLTDQYLPPRLPAYRNANIYPLARQRLGRARALARGQTRNRKAVIYTFAGGPPVVFAQIVKRNLEQIGLEAEVRAIPNLFERIAQPGEPWDLALLNWAGDYSDPYAYLNVLFDGRYAGRSNASRFDSPRYNRLLRQAARRRGGARERAYGRLDARLARDAAPFVAVDYLSDATFISKNVDPWCVVLRPTPGWGLDLTAVCLKR
jgi:peptide/nickel transport system substrate-binding protein